MAVSPLCTNRRKRATSGRKDSAIAVAAFVTAPFSLAQAMQAYVKPKSGTVCRVPTRIGRSPPEGNMNGERCTCQARHI